MNRTLHTTTSLELQSLVMQSVRSYTGKHLANTVDSRFLYNMFTLHTIGTLNDILFTLKSQTHGSINIGTSI